MLQIVLIFLACWIGLSLTALFFGRAGHQADDDAVRLHAELAIAREDAAPAERPSRRRALQT